MTRLAHTTTAGLLIGAVLLSACGSPQQYARFAKAGTAYATAMDSLLVATNNAGINATSERLLQDDELSNQNLDSYKKLSDEDRQRLETIRQLRAHVRLLADYFGTLYQLATSDAPERAAQSVGGIVTNLNSVGNRLRGSPLLENNTAVSTVTKLVVGSIIRGKLKDELDQRKDTIRLEIKTQEELMKALAAKIEHSLKLGNEVREKRQVIDPLTAADKIAKPDEWIANRRAVLNSQTTVAELASASEAAKKFGEAFEDLVSGKLTLDKVNGVISDFEAILTVVEAIKQ